MYFEINTAQARQEAADLQRLAGSIDMNVFYISALYVSLRLVGAPSIQYVVKRVQKQNAALAQESRRLRAMGTSLNKIAGYYDNADSSVASKRAVTGSVLNDVFYKRNNGASNTEMDELINRFEKEHPEYAEKFDNLIASDKKKMLTEDDIRRIKYLAYTAEEPYRTIYLETLERYTIGDSNMAEGAYYMSVLEKIPVVRIPRSFMKAVMALTILRICQRKWALIPMNSKVTAMEWAGM